MINDKNYFEWLCNRYELTEQYTKLAELLYREPFKPQLKMDENREADGKYIRVEYFQNTGFDLSLDAPTSMLELLGSLATPMYYLCPDWSEAEWFHQLLVNGGVDVCTDDALHNNYALQTKVTQWMDRINMRTYKPNGFGGIFPITHFDPPNELSDQRTVELWYQMGQWLMTEHLN